MGLLDDAIREHLDLKRARGGDPADIERMEREALGPVRREPTIGSARLEEAAQHAPSRHDEDYHEEFDYLQDAGYHDSTAPHPHHGHEHAHPEQEFADTDLGHEHPDPFGLREQEPEQPRRRFLRRNRAVTPPEPDRLDPGFHEEPPLEPYEHHLAPEHHGQYEHDEDHEQFEPLEHDALAEHEPPGDPVQSEPPHLQFDHPPKRPRFTAEPPVEPPTHEEDAGSIDPAADTAEHAAAGPQPGEEPEDSAAAQETTEFDVERHIAETRHLPDEEPEPAQGATADDDMLEETPEFLQDTPEHDRLWFEQRPPKDFDF